MKKKRLDQWVLERGLAPTRSKAQALIMAGEILVDGTPRTKGGHAFSEEVTITLAYEGPRYVSRGGIKLAGALDNFEINPKGWSCLDVGASTGGFTDCLLQRGASKVCTVDVGKGQLDSKIRNDERVTWKESFHVNELTPATFGIEFHLATVDVSFISLKKVLPRVLPCLKEGGTLLALIKPQFEAKAKEIARGGVLKNEGRRQEILTDLKAYTETKLGLINAQVTDSTLPGPKGNLEAFLCGHRPPA